MRAALLAALLVVGGGHALTTFAVNIECNAGTQWHCTCFLADAGVEGWQPSECPLGRASVQTATIGCATSSSS